MTGRERSSSYRQRCVDDFLKQHGFKDGRLNRLTGLVLVEVLTPRGGAPLVLSTGRFSRPPRPLVQDVNDPVRDPCTAWLRRETIYPIHLAAKTGDLKVLLLGRRTGTSDPAPASRASRTSASAASLFGSPVAVRWNERAPEGSKALGLQ